MSAQLNPASFAIPTSLYHGYSDMQVTIHFMPCDVISVNIISHL
uniref:Uncharacterized protein n=1 Tax=Heterorhabditis bacteriophora TaxID=37862 RepID=A0A1I7X8D1_HETBA